MGKSKRKIIRIDETKCNGCGQCAQACAEGAIAIIDGKARLVSETYCDGLGACLGECPTGALTIEERSADDFDEAAVHKHLAKQKAQSGGGCPGSALRTFQSQSAGQGGGCPGSAVSSFTAGGPAAAAGDEMPPSALGQWPVQLMLVPPGAPFLQGAHLLICADCVPFAVPDFHTRYLQGKAVLVGCPKLDDLEHYRLKLQQILAEAEPASLTVLRMEVPCCAGIANAVLEARDVAAPEMPVEIHTIGIRGGIRRNVSPGQSSK